MSARTGSKASFTGKATGSLLSIAAGIVSLLVMSGPAAAGTLRLDELIAEALGNSRSRFREYYFFLVTP